MPRVPRPILLPSVSAPIPSLLCPLSLGDAGPLGSAVGVDSLACSMHAYGCYGPSHNSFTLLRGLAEPFLFLLHTPSVTHAISVPVCVCVLHVYTFV